MVMEVLYHGHSYLMLFHVCKYDFLSICASSFPV